jgi:hypothetical protein
VPRGAGGGRRTASRRGTATAATAPAAALARIVKFYWLNKTYRFGSSRPPGGVARPTFSERRAATREDAAVRVDPELGTVVWPNGADLDPGVLVHALAPARE